MWIVIIIDKENNDVIYNHTFSSIQEATNLYLVLNKYLNRDKVDLIMEEQQKKIKKRKIIKKG